MINGERTNSSNSIVSVMDTDNKPLTIYRYIHNVLREERMSESVSILTYKLTKIDRFQCVET